MWAAEFSVVVRRLYHERKLAFDSWMFSEALDALHSVWWKENLPETVEWSTELFLDSVRGRIADKGGLFDPDAAPGP